MMPGKSKALLRVSFVHAKSTTTESTILTTQCLPFVDADGLLEQQSALVPMRVVRERAGRETHIFLTPNKIDVEPTRQAMQESCREHREVQRYFEVGHTILGGQSRKVCATNGQWLAIGEKRRRRCGDHPLT